MQKFIAKYVLAAHLAVLAVAPLCLLPSWVAWLSLLGAIWLLMEPSRIKGESLRSARSRVVSAVVRDPFFWFSVVFLSYYVIAYFNTGVTLSYDAQEAKWFMSQPPMPLMPSSTDGFKPSAITSVLAMIVVTQGCRHALGKQARFGFAVVFSFVSGLISFIMISALVLGNVAYLDLAKCSFENPQFLGIVFGISSLVSVSALASVFEFRIFRVLVMVLFGIVGSLAGLFIFAPAHIAAFFAIALIMLFLYAIFYAFKLPGALIEFKYAVVLFISISIAVIVVIFSLSDEIMEMKTLPFQSVKTVLPQLSELREALSKIAFSVWRDNLWLGTGFETFPLDIKFNATDGAFAVIPESQTKPLSGYLLLLAENGIVGSVMYTCLYGFLLFTYIRRFCMSLKASISSPISLTGFLALSAVAAAAAFDCSFLLPEATVVLCMTMSLSSVSFSKGAK